MKKKEKFYPENNQEDEDGYTPQTDAKKKHRLSTPGNFENKRPGFSKLQTRSLMPSSFQQSLER
jgi:hypothetical protein